MTPDEMKKQAAYAALEHINTDGVVGVGTGSTKRNGPLIHCW